MEKKSFFSPERRAGIAALVLAVIGFVVYALPFAHYRYNSSYYSLSGYDLAAGKAIMNGSVQVNPVIYQWVALACICVSLVFAVIILLQKMPKLSALFIFIAGAVQIIMQVITLVTIKDILDGAKRVAVEPGMYGGMAVGLALIVCACYLLTKKEVLSTLDFMVIPGLTYLIINNYLPMVGIQIAWKKLDFSVGIWRSPWCGWENFKFLFASGDAGMIIRNTIAYNAFWSVLGIFTGMAVGIGLAEVFSKIVQRVSQTLILLPQLISMVIVAYIVYGFLSTSAGWINKGLLGNAEINWYGVKKYWPFILTVVHVWKGLGYSSIIYLSGIVGIDRNLYEASYIDGCGKMKQITKITVPMMKPTIVTLLIMSCGRIMYSDFGLFYQVTMNSGALYTVTTTLDVYVYRALMQLNNLSMSSAASAFQSICGFFLVMTVNQITRWLDRENAMF